MFYSKKPQFVRGQLEGFRSNASGTKCLIFEQVFQSAHVNVWVHLLMVRVSISSEWVKCNIQVEPGLKSSRWGGQWKVESENREDKHGVAFWVDSDDAGGCLMPVCWPPHSQTPEVVVCEVLALIASSKSLFNPTGPLTCLVLWWPAGHLSLMLATHLDSYPGEKKCICHLCVCESVWAPACLAVICVLAVSPDA